tara:strand:+ start:344 stop:550 length:207 start_codon:yes stop_codon:yes gene_type:complete
MKEYTISVLVRRPGKDYTHGHGKKTVTAVNFDEAYSMVKEAVEADGWEVEGPLLINWKPCPVQGEEGD